jgi:hypothetical protein
LKRKELRLSVCDLLILNEFISLLALFGEATTIIQAQNVPSISLVAPCTLSIYFSFISYWSTCSALEDVDVDLSVGNATHSKSHHQIENGNIQTHNQMNIEISPHEFNKVRG